MAIRGRGAFPAGGLGYTRGNSEFQYGGTGSGQGTMAQGTMSRGQGLGPISAMAGQWEPGPLYLIGLVVLEMVAVHLLGRLLS